MPSMIHSLTENVLLAQDSFRGNKLTKLLYELIQALELKIFWRYNNPMKNGHTYFFPCHNLFSRTDRMWATVDLLLHTYDIEFFPKTLTNHNPILWSINSKRKPSSWCFNSDIWRDPNFSQ